jgi:Ala-tRNA(Pro) deacylase
MNVHEYLQGRAVAFRDLPHKRTIGARLLARALEEDPARVAKTVVLAADGDYVVCVVPADRRVDLVAAARVLGVPSVRVASELECEALFPDSELGAMPPFGSLHGLKTLLDIRLTDGDELIFEGDTHRSALAVQLADFREVERPNIRDISRQA